MREKSNWVAFPDVTEKTEGLIDMGYTGLPSDFDEELLLLNVGALKRYAVG